MDRKLEFSLCNALWSKMKSFPNGAKPEMILWWILNQIHSMNKAVASDWLQSGQLDYLDAIIASGAETLRHVRHFISPTLKLFSKKFKASYGDLFSLYSSKNMSCLEFMKPGRSAPRAPPVSGTEESFVGKQWLPGGVVRHGLVCFPTMEPLLCLEMEWNETKWKHGWMTTPTKIHILWHRLLFVDVVYWWWVTLS